MEIKNLFNRAISQIQVKNIGLGVLAGIALMVFVFWIFTDFDFKLDFPGKTSPVAVLKTPELVMGVGWSKNPDERQAVQEAFAMMQEEMGGKNPNFVIITSESGYDNQIVAEQLDELLIPSARVYGWTSMIGSANPGGIVQGENGSISLLGFASSKMDVGVGGCSLEEVSYPGEGASCEDIFEAGRAAGKLSILRAIEDSGRSADEKPKFVLISGATYFLPGTLECPIEERFIEGVESVVGNEVPIIGGLGADTMAQGNEKVFAGDIYAGDRIYGFGSIAAAAVYTDLKVGYAFLGGFTPTTKKATVTRASGHVLYELDDRPCADVYNEWTNNGLGERINTAGEWVIDFTTLYPLSEKISEGSSVPGYYNKLIHYFNDPEPGVCKVACEVKEGDIVYLLEGTPNMFINRGAMTAMLARADGGISKDEIAGGYMIFCAGSFLTIPSEDYPRISQAINDVLGGAPFIGGYEFGGFGSFLGVEGNRFSTQMASFLVFGKN